MNRIRCECLFHVRCPDALARKMITDVNVVRYLTVENGFYDACSFMTVLEL
jgi:hypothetical protein